MKNVLKDIKHRKLYRKMVICYCYTRGLFLKNGLIRNYICFPVKAFFRLHKISPFYEPYAKLDSMRDRHKGKRIFVIATGPSLKIEDVEMLKGEITIGVNGIFRMYSHTEWRPTYYLVGDYNLMNKYKQTNEDRYEEYSQKEFFLSDYNGMKEHKDAVFFPVSWLDHMVYYGSCKFKYCRDLLWGTYCMYTVTNAAINFADYMGANEIYLLGVDCNYLGEKPYFGEGSKEEREKSEVLKSHEMMQKGYQFIKSVLDQRDVKVYNATRGGNLEVFPRKALEDVLQEK